MSQQRFLLQPKQAPVPIPKQLSKDEVRELMGSQNVMFVHLPNNDLMLGVNYDGALKSDETTLNETATAIYKKNIKNGLVYGTCLLVPKSDFAPAE